MALLSIGWMVFGQACADSDADTGSNSGPNNTAGSGSSGGSGPDAAIMYENFSARPCHSDNALTYDNFGMKFFDTYCTRCHSGARSGLEREGAPLGLNLDSIDSIRPLREIIWSIAADSQTIMPPTAPRPTPDERRQLGEWLACDAASADP